MLILSRKLGQPLLLGDNIEIKVVEICKRRVRLGIIAPPNVKVVRAELLQRVGQVPGTRTPDGRLEEVNSEELMGDAT